MPHDIEFIFKIIICLSICIIIAVFILSNYTEVGKGINNFLFKFKDVDKDMFHLPPGNGYMYHVINSRGNETSVVYILKKGKKKFHVYLVKGNRDPRTDLRRSRYGTYFCIHCKTDTEAETAIDSVFRR